MATTEVLIDADFLQKITSDGKHVDELLKLFDTLGFSPVLHPYTANCELEMFEYVQELIKNGHIRVSAYDEFLFDETDYFMYQKNFCDIHDRLRENLELKSEKKQLEKLAIPDGMTIFNYRKAGMSLGDVHMILMAYFTKMPVILSNDSDFNALKEIIKNYIDNDDYRLVILTSFDVIIKVASMEQKDFTKKDLLNILKYTGQNSQKSKVTQAWNNSHNTVSNEDE